MPPHGGIFVGLWLLLVPGVTGSPPGAGGATLAFVFDTTGSMYDDLVQVTEGASRILERTLSRGTKLIRNYVLVPFHDPEVGPATLTTDPRLFQQRLQQLQVKGGGDCPEMSVAAIRLAAEVSHPNSFIYVFTDARAKDYEQQEELLRLLQHKQSQVVFVLTGDCGDRSHPGYRVYERIAATSSGQVFHLDKQQVKEVLKWVEEAIQASKVHLLSADHEDGGEHTWPVPFDPSLKEVTVSLSGPAPQIEVRDPAGKVLEKGRDLKELLSIPDSAVVVAVQPHEPGMWQVKTQSSGRHSVRITGVSSINFQAGFSTQPDPDSIQPGERPLQGLPVSVVVNCSGLEPPGRLQEIELFNSSGRALLSLPLRPLSNASSGQLWVGSPLRAPPGDFLLKVKGEDAQGHPLHRLSSVTYTSVVPGLPQVNISSRIRAYRREPQRVSCWAHSELPFRMQLSRAGARLGEEKKFRGSGNVSWLIPAASKSDEGFYECTATNKVGVARARAYISVSEPPPRLQAPGNVTASPGHDVVLSCPVLSAVPYNLTWSWDGRVALQEGGRARLLQNHSLEISRVQPGDAGPYECIARSAHGTATASVWLFIQEVPWVEVDASPQRFGRGQELRLNCTAGGYPQPRVTWKRWGWVLEQDQRVFMDSQGTLHIRAAVPEDAGNYSCSANSLLGQDEQAISLEYIEPPAILAVTPGVKALVGEDVTLECWVSGVPPPQIAWHKGEQEVAVFPAGSQRGVLRLQAVQEEDAGPYTCQARGEAGDASASTVLDVGSAPHFPEPLGDLEAEIGDRVTLPCRAEGSLPLQVAWSRQDGKPVVQQHGLPGAELLIDGASLDDQAVYVCEAQNDFGKIRAEVKLTVTGQAPAIALAPAVVRVLAGQPLWLPCVILAGRPLPARLWLKDGQPVAPSGRFSTQADGSLHVGQVSRGDAGTYTCVATNALGSQRQEVALVVHVPPSIEPGPALVAATEGAAITLRCDATGVPTPTVTWTKGTEPVSPSPRYHLNPNGTLLIPSPSPGDAGTYFCTAASVAGFSSRQVQLSISTKPRISVNGSRGISAPVPVLAVRGQEATLPCEAQGSPLPLVAWSRESRPLPLSSSRYTVLPSGSLRLAEPQEADSGLYTCTATNAVGNASVRYSLRVQVPPRIQRGPEVLRALVGERLELPCVAHGDPVPSLSWSKDSRPLQEGERGALGGPHGAVTIGAVQLSDAGRYRCIASSSVGQDAVEVVVQVLEPPYLGDGAEVLLEKVLHENVTITCPVKGTPMPSVLWWKDAVEVQDAVPGAELLDGGSLFIHALQPSHSGDYTCLAANDVGSVSLTTTLVVHGPPEMMGSGWENVSVVAGQPLELHCNVSGTPVPSITWHKDGHPVDGAGGPLLLRRGQTLRFAAVRSEDTGTYSCTARSRAGEARRHFVLLVLVPPSMSGSRWPHNVSVPEGSEVLLECRSRGVPPPRVRWMKDGQPLPAPDPHLELLEEEQVLRIPSSQPQHQGTYQCLATNPAGQHSKVFQLHVHTPPSILGAEELVEVVVLLNGSGQLPCEARGSPAPTISWFRGRRPLPSGTRTTYMRGGRALRVSGAQEADAGLYVCLATNPAGTAHRTVRLEVYVPPTISSEGRVVEAAVGQPVELPCSASGNPLPTLSWQKDGQPLPQGAGVLLLAGGMLLRVQRVSESSGGSYTCLASSPAGESMVRHTLLVQAPPKLLIGDGESHLTAVANDSLRIRCRASGVPMPRIRWLKDGLPLGAEDGVAVSEDSGTLLIARVGLAHQGLYICQGSSRAGGAQVQLWVLVQARPSVSIAEGDAVTVALRQPVTLRCQATGTPPPRLSWRKDGVPLPATGSIFQIEKADLTDEGVYTCVAANPAGEDEQDVMLKVLVPPNIEPSEVDLAVLENGTASLECLATGVPAPDISWYKGNEQLVTTPGRILSRDGKRLEIPRAHLSDAGSYRCVASNAAGDTELGYSLRVTVPPRITAGPSPVVAVTSEAVTLRCDATGSPAPALLWLKDGNPVPEEVAGGPQILSGGRVLSLPTPRLLDSGTYTCVASSAVGEDRREATVEVRLPPTAPGEEENVSAIVNQEVTLHCPAPGVDPRGSRWLKDGTLLTPSPGMSLSEDGTVLQVGRAAVQDAGRYTCQVPGHPERHYNLNVLVPPSFPSAEPTTVSVLEGQSVRLACECHGIPFPALSWQKDGEPLSAHPGSPKLVSAGGRMLYIERVRLVDEGTYTCECNNAAGGSSKEHRLGVHVPPRIRGSSKAPRKVSVIEAGETVLECEATGRPAPTVTWLKDGQPVALGDGLSLSEQGWRLRIAQAAPVHAGRYVCLAANAAGQERREFDVVVHVPPKLLQGSGSTSNIRVPLHRALTLTCEATGVPLPTVSWSWKGSPVTPGEHTQVLSGGWMLRLPRVRAQDGGHYSCLASNAAGEARREFQVEILVPPHIEDVDEEEAVTVPEGHPVTWSCLAAGNPQPEVTWLKDGDPLPAGATSISPDGSVLRIPQAAPSDAGRYSCVASSPAGEQTKHYLLNVSASPTSAGDAHDAATEDVVVIINNPISLLCEAPAYPPPSITWLKDEVPIEASRDVRLLPVPPLITRDVPSGEFATTEVRTRVNSTVTLECETWAVPEPTIQWYKDGQLLESAGHLQILQEGQVLQIKPAGVPDSGHYTCVATNPLGADDKDFSVHVQVPPLFQHQLSPSEAFEILYQEEDGDGEVTEHRQAVLHQPAALSCDTNSIPPPRLTWYKDGEPLAPGPGVLILLGGRVLQLPVVQEEDAGRYTCEASNEAGRDRVHYELEVLAAPAIRGAEEEQVEEVTATTNSTVRFECAASGRPVPAVSWLRDHVPIAASPRHQLLEGGTVLQVAVAEVGDAGSYVCVAENPAGSAEKHFALTVLEPPGAEDPQEETLSADMGSPLVLSCAATAVPAVTWLKDGRTLASSPEQGLVPGGGQLQISALQPSHQGRYTCLAPGEGTEMRKDFLVLVRVAPRILGAGVPSEHSVLEGGEVRLECQAEGQPPPQISWLKDGQPLQLQPPSRAQVSPDGSALLLEALRAADSGAYTCLARNGAGEDARLHVLSVLVPPVIEGGADGSDVVRGVLAAAVTLRCRARGSPPLRVSWLKDGLPLRLSPRVMLLSAGHVLRISRTQVSDAGLYTCVVSSQAGVADRSFVLQILAPPVLESPESSEEQVVAKGSDVTFACEASGSPAPAVTWLKLGETPALPSKRVADGPRLSLGAVGPADTGVYACVAANEAGEASRAFSLLVMEPPKIEDASHPTEMAVAVGTPLELTCVVAGVPAPAVTWEKDGQLLAGPWLSAGNESTLHIDSMEVADSGLYTCLATSPAGEDSRSFHVSARAPLGTTGTTETLSITAVPGGQLTLECPVDAVPPPYIEWHREGSPLWEDARRQILAEGRFLRIWDVGAADGGEYVCRAGTATGDSRQSFQVEIHVAPHIQPGPEEVNVPTNGSATLLCQAEGWPTPRVTWRKDGQLLSLRGTSRLQLLPDGSLHIDPIRVQDSGYYLCVASSPAGSDRRGLDLRVLVPPAITPGPPSLTLLAPQPAWLSCDASGSPAPQVRWEKDGHPLNPHLLPGAYRVQTSGSLLITSPSPRDEGWFECIATNAAGEARKVFLVSVHVPPTIADDLTDVAVTRLSPAVLTCYASGVPKPAVSWSKDGAQLGSRGGGYRVLPTGALEIRQALPVHAGRYTCTARSTAGTARKHLRLVVHEPPALKPLPGMVMVKVNASTVLSCEVSGVPRPEVTWQKDGASIPGGPGLKVLPSGQLHLLRASLADAGSYLCVARNPSGTAMGRTRLIVQVPPTIAAGPVELAVLEGQDVLLPCTARGVPEPRVSWSRDGAPVRDRGGTVTILPSGELLLHHVQEGDAGSYSCTAVNSAGKAIRRLSLGVHTLPTFTRRPGDVVLSRGEQLELVCEATGSPEPHISWTADGRPLTEGVSGQRGRSILRRAAATHADSGTYVCRAENSAGTIRATSFVSVMEAPVVRGAPSTYQVEPPGADVLLDCDTRGHPAPFIRWSKDGVPVGATRRLRQLQNGSLAIRNLGGADVGLYRCVAENEVGTAAKVVTLALQSPPVVVVTPRAVSVRTGQRVLLHCAVSGEPTPSVEWQWDGEALPEGPRGRILPNATLLLPAASPRDTGTYTCIARNALGSAAARASLVVQGEPRRVRGSLMGVINTREFGVATLNASVLDEPRSGTTAIRTTISGVPRHVGSLMRVLVTLMAPVYWSFAHTGGDVPGGILLARGTFRHESQVEFGTGDLLRITHLARGADASGTLLLDSVLSGSVPESIGDATLLLQDFSERYVRTGAGRFSGESVQSFLQDGRLARARCNHTIEYEPAPGLQPQRVQHIQAREVQASFDPASEELSFQLSTSLDAGDQCPPGFVLGPQQLHCLDINECAEGSHACRYNQICENTVGTHRCVCPRGYRSLGAAWPCLDINECLHFPPPCAFECRNLRGSYECLCPPGMVLLPEGECGAAGTGGGAAGSTPWDSLLRWLGPGSRLRSRLHPRLTLSRVAKAAGPDARGPCPSGFVRRNGTCTDLDECRVPNQCQHQCRNSEGSYRCVCPPGYRLLPDGKSCQDVDECGEGTLRCASSQLCFNTRGGARCEDTPCPDGYWRGSSPGVCFSHCAPDCGTDGPAVLRHVLLPLPLGVPAGHDVLRLAPGTALGARTLFSLLEQDGGSPFALRAEQGRGVIATLRPLHAPGTHHLRVQALTPGARRARSIFLIIISISPYPY
ncbi:hemicentin-2 isoform X2 [Anas acuta]|uniref:hemicentin-2 isoform X2 n=1 Tax=Anas acuta TaxID=28680 RepID=UPI0035C8C431